MAERELPSESEESDEDYVPSGEEGQASEEDSDGDIEDKPEPGSGDEAPPSKSRKRKNKARGKRSRKRAKAASPPPEPEEIEEKSEETEEQLKKKADDLWAEFKKDTEVKKPSKTTECSVAVSSDKSTASSSKTTVSKEQPKPITEIKTFEFAGEKVRVNVKKPSTASLFPSSSYGRLGTKFPNSGNGIPSLLKKTVQRKTSVNDVGLCSVTQPIQKAVAAPTSTTAKPTAAPSKGLGIKISNSGVGIPSRAGGLAAALGQLGKKNKLSTLEKSKLDWEGYKEQNGLSEEIQNFNRGKHGYLEKQDFLQRTDLRQFELEKQMRASTRRSNR